MFRDGINRRARRHRAREARESVAVAGDVRARVLGDDGQGVAGRDEEFAAEYEVAVAVAVAGRAEVGRVVAEQALDQLGGVDEIRVGVMTSEVGQRCAVDDRAGGRAQFFLDDLSRVRAGGGAPRVETHSEAAAEESAQPVEVEQLLHDGRVVFERVDDEDVCFADARRAFAFEVNVRVFDGEVACDLSGLGVDALGDGFGRGAAVARVVLDAEVFFDAAGVVAGREDESAEGASAAYDGGDGGGGEYAAATDEQGAEAVGGGHADDCLRGLAVVEATVAADDERLVFETSGGVGAHGVEDRLHEVLKVAGPHEDARLLAQTRSARTLPLERGRRDGLHASLSRRSQGSPPRMLMTIAVRTVYAVLGSEAKQAAELIRLQRQKPRRGAMR